MPKQTQGRSATSPFMLVLKPLEADIKEYNVSVLIVQDFWLRMGLLRNRILVKRMSA